MLENYIAYLMVLDEKLNRFFNEQKPYIFCRPGCSKCCRNAIYPYSRIELEYLKTGFNRLPYNIKEQIRQNIEKTINDKKNFKGEKFTYVCPFLVNDMCSVYNQRGIICRTFGLMQIYPKGGQDIPFCVELGLNYSNVYDPEKNIISKEMFKTLGVKEEPNAYNIAYDFLTDADFGKGFGFEFGEVKPLIDWFID